MEDEKIEVLDIDDIDVVDNNIESDDNSKEKILIETDTKNTTKIKKRRLKKGIIQTIFCLSSLFFIIGCCIFYGSRLIKYYKIYNPKSESGEKITLISNALIHDTPIVFEGSGVYRENGVYVYKGAEANNYIKYANLTWRIIRTNADGSLEIILDDYINALAWDFEDKDYISSDIHKYLNEVFVKNLNTDYLVKTSICNDTMESIDKYSCNDKNNNYYVKLLPANDFLNSVADGESYIADSDQLIWLGTKGIEGKVWHTNGANISTSPSNSGYLVKPVVTIKNSTALISGNGTMDSPFTIEQESKNIKVGSYIKLDGDEWIVYEKNDKNIKLVYSNLYTKKFNNYRFDVEKNEFDPESENSLAYLLNNDFYEELSYKDLLLDFEVYTGDYNTSYKDVYETKIKVKVGIQNITDLKFNNDASGYFLSTKGSENKVLCYGEDTLFYSKPAMARGYRPTISIKIPKTYKGDGTLDSPFVIEVSNENE